MLFLLRVQISQITKSSDLIMLLSFYVERRWYKVQKVIEQYDGINTIIKLITIDARKLNEHCFHLCRDRSWPPLWGFVPYINYKVKGVAVIIIAHRGEEDNISL